MNLNIILLAYIVSILVGGQLARYWVIYLRKKIDSDYDPNKERILAIDWSLGTIERGITTTLVIWHPSLAPAFIGGWVALKFAANWGKRSSSEDRKEQEKVARQRLTGLIGSAVSLGTAIACGLIVNPDALLGLSN